MLPIIPSLSQPLTPAQHYLEPTHLPYLTADSSSPSNQNVTYDQTKLEACPICLFQEGSAVVTLQRSTHPQTKPRMFCGQGACHIVQLQQSYTQSETGVKFPLHKHTHSQPTE